VIETFRKSPLWQSRNVLARYGLALAFSLAAAGIAKKINPIIGESTAPLFFAAVMLSAWRGGLGPGLLATAVAGYLSGVYELNPVGSPDFGLDDTLRVGMFLMVAVLISSLTSLRQRAETALKRSYDELEIRIEQRTRELRESEERFRLLVDGVADYAIVTLNTGGDIVSWNPGAQRIFGFHHDEVIGLNTSRFFTPDDRARGKPRSGLLEAEQVGRHQDEGWRVRADGTRFWADVVTTALRDEASRPRGFAQVTRDVTELRSLEKELLDISEREQMRIGHDLHDGVGQELTGVALLSQNLHQRLRQRQLPEAAEAARIASLVNGALEQTRQLARGFSTMELGPEGLEPALRNMAAQVQETMRRRCIVVCAGPIRISDDAIALHLYRIAQEAMNNVMRHAKPKQIRIELDIIGGAVVLAVHDDGCGLPATPSVRKGMGIRVMQYRARLIGATLEIRSGSSGTTVLCTCPLQAENDLHANTNEEKVVADPVARIAR